MDFKKKTLFIMVAGIIIIMALVWKAAIPLVDETRKLGSDIKVTKNKFPGFARYTNYMADLKRLIKK